MVWLSCQNWVFRLDKVRSMDYSAAEAADHCCCGYCNNFYATVDASYPNLRTLLGDFGLDIEAPDMMIPLDTPTDCVLYYSVAGEIIQNHKRPIAVDNLTIFPQSDCPEFLNSSVDMPCFYLCVEGIRLPWAMRQQIEDIASSANAPEFLERTREALLSSN